MQIVLLLWKQHVYILFFPFILGEKDIICIEDLIHEIKTLGPNFKYATNFLMPFKLSTPLGGWRRKYQHFKDGGSYGDRNTEIDALVKQMI